MPRSAKASARASIPKRTSKRNTSAQGDVYSIPESPEFSSEPAREEILRATGEVDEPLIRGTSPKPTRRGRSMSTSSMSTSSTKVGEDLDTTPTQSKKIRSRVLSSDDKQAMAPGLEVLEAVNGLYQKLRDSQIEVAELKQKLEQMAKQVEEYEKDIHSLETELALEKKNVKKMEQLQDTENTEARKTAESELNIVLTSLQQFSKAAFNLMPLLDVLSDAPEIQYDEHTERLYNIWKQRKDRDETRGKAKSELHSSRN